MGDKDAGNSQGDFCAWVKPNVKSLGGNRLTQTLEFFLILYYSHDGKMNACHFNFDAQDIRPKSIEHPRVISKVVLSLVFAWHGHDWHQQNCFTPGQVYNGWRFSVTLSKAGKSFCKAHQEPLLT